MRKSTPGKIIYGYLEDMNNGYSIDETYKRIMNYFVQYFSELGKD